MDNIEFINEGKNYAGDTRVIMLPGDRVNAIPTPTPTQVQATPVAEVIADVAPVAVTPQPVAAVIDVDPTPVSTFAPVEVAAVEQAVQTPPVAEVIDLNKSMQNVQDIIRDAVEVINRAGQAVVGECANALQKVEQKRLELEQRELSINEKEKLLIDRQSVLQTVETSFVSPSPIDSTPISIEGAAVSSSPNLTLNNPSVPASASEPTIEPVIDLGKVA